MLLWPATELETYIMACKLHLHGKQALSGEPAKQPLGGGGTGGGGVGGMDGMISMMQIMAQLSGSSASQTYNL